MMHPSPARLFSAALLTAAMVLAAPRAHAQQKLRSELVVSGLQQPVWVGGAPGDPTRLFVIEKIVSGQTVARIRVINNANTANPTLNPVPFLEVPNVANVGIEQGLLGMVFHPDYANNGYFWFTFSRDPDWYWTLHRGHRSAANPDQADPTTELVWQIQHPRDNHYSGWLEFGNDGYLYTACGDGGGSNDDQPPSGDVTGNAQDTTNNKLGKIFRLDVDGWDNIPGNADDDGVPDDPTRNYRNPLDNPFFGVPGDDEIWAYGVRNAWRASFDRATGELYVADVGQDLQEEVTVLPPVGGLNLGWRCYEGYRETGLGGCSPLPTPVVMPIIAYGHYGSPIPPLMNEGCAITGGVVYRGSLMPCYRGTYMFADWCSGDVFTFRKGPGGAVQELVARRDELIGTPPNQLNRPTSFGTDMYGEMYVTDQQGGEVFRILPDGFQAPFDDCNNNQVPDDCDIASGTSLDADGDGVPDECVTSLCDPVDFNGDTLFPDTADIADFITVFAGGECPTGTCGDIDFNNDDLFPDTTDVAALISVFAGGECIR
ncbi:MAG: PQQ-dependent sugar dehydrogenase [Phycisphaerales bacterium]